MTVEVHSQKLHHTKSVSLTAAGGWLDVGGVRGGDRGYQNEKNSKSHTEKSGISLRPYLCHARTGSKICPTIHLHTVLMNTQLDILNGSYSTHL